MTNFLTEQVQIITADHLELPGLLFTERQPRNPPPQAAIYLHGNGDSSVFYSVKRIQAYAEALTAQGIAFLAFNNRGAHFIKSLDYQEKKFDQSAITISAKNKKRQDIIQGSAYELIEECEHDINGAANYLLKRGFKTLYLIGHSTGANKICVYDHHQPNSVFSKYVLLAGGDDTGLLRDTMGHSAFQSALERAHNEIAKGRGQTLVPHAIYKGIMSYQSFFDMANPDGEYNTFPFLEHLRRFQLSTLPLFRYFKALSRPALIIYGEHDEYAPGSKGALALEILRQQVQSNQICQFELILGADHSFHHHEKELANLFASWLKRE